MTLLVLPLDPESARVLLGWRYDPPYDIYNHRPEEIEEDLRYVLDPGNGFFGIHAADGALVGFCSFGKDAQVPGGKYAEDLLDIGLGLRPDRTGRGTGPAVIGVVLKFAGRTFHPAGFRVTIASFNKRARRAWEKAGFVETQRFRRSGDGSEFVILEWDVRRF